MKEIKNKLKAMWLVLKSTDFIGIPTHADTPEEIQKVLKVIYAIKNRYEQKMKFCESSDNPSTNGTIDINIEKTKATLHPVIEP